MEKKKIDGKKKGVASIPANYVSILQLQERWMKEKKEGKHMGKGLVERGLVDDEERKREEEEAMEPREDKNLCGGSRRPCGVNLSEPKCVEKEKKWSKKNQGGSKEEVVNCESKASPAYIREENNPIWSVKTPNVVRDSVSVESQFQDLCINKKDQGREVKGPAEFNNGKIYERHDWSSSTRHVIKARKAMVWVAKGNKNHGAVGV